MEDQEFEACIRQIQAGKKEGLKQIYEAYAALVYTVIYDLVRQREDAEDLAAECFVRLWERADTYRFGGKHRGWLLTIARNLAIDFLRRQKRELVVEEVRGQEHCAKDVAEQAVENVSFEEALKQLERDEQEVLDLKIVGQMTFREIAQVLKKPQGTVAWLYRKGIEKLRKYHQQEQGVRG